MGYSLIGLGSGAFAPAAANFFPFGMASANAFSNATEANYQMPMPAAGIISGLRCDQGAFSGSFVGQLRKNGANAYQNFSQGLPVAIGSDAVAQGDLIDLQFPSVTTPSLVRIQAMFQATSGHAALYAGPTGGGTLATNTYYLRSFASGGGGTALLGAQAKALTAGTASRLYVNAITNTTTAPSSAAYNANGANGAQTLAIGAGLTGVFTDATHTDAIALGDLYCVALVVGAGGGIGVGSQGFAFSNPATAGNDLYCTVPSITATTGYCCLYGTNGVASATEAPVQIAHGFPVTLSGLSAVVTANATTSNSTISLRRNSGASSVGTIVVAAGLTGWFSSSGSQDYTATDLANYQMIGGPGGAIAAFMIGVCETADPPPAPQGFSLIGVGTNDLTYVPTIGYSGPYGGSMIQSVLIASGTGAQVPFPIQATLTNTIGDPAVCTGSLHGSIAKNGATANNWGTTFGTGGSLNFLVGDVISMGWGASTTMPRVTSVLQHTGGYHGGFYAAAGNQAFTPGVTYYPRFAANLLAVTNAALKGDLRSGAAGTLQRMAINVLANAATAASTLATDLNDGTIGNQTISIGAGMTGIFVDATHTDAVLAGDLFCGQLIVGAGGNLTVSVLAIGFVNTATQASDLYASGPTANPAGAVLWWCFIGSNSQGGSLGFDTEAHASISHGFWVMLTTLAVAINVNGATAASSVVTRKNGATGALSISIGAGLTGWFTDTMHRDILAPTDVACLMFTAGAGGSVTLFNSAVTELAGNLYAQSVAETGAAADVTTTLPKSFGLATAESGSASDTMNGIRTTFVSVAETGAAADGPGSTASSTMLVTESGSAADSTASTYASGEQVVEAGSAADTSNRAVMIGPIVSEFGSAADHVNGANFLPLEVDESGDAEDVEDIGAFLSESIAETGSAVDAVNFFNILALAVVEVAPPAQEMSDAFFNPMLAEVDESGDAEDANDAVTDYADEVDEVGDAEDSSIMFPVIPLDLADAADAEDVTDAAYTIFGETDETGDAEDAYDAQANFGVAQTEAGDAEDASDTLGDLVADIEEAGDAEDASDTVADLTLEIDEVADAEDATDDALELSLEVDELGGAYDNSDTLGGINLLVVEIGDGEDAVNAVVYWLNEVDESADAEDASDSMGTFLLGDVDEVGDAEDTSDMIVPDYRIGVAETGAAQDQSDDIVQLGVAVLEAADAEDLTDVTAQFQLIVIELGAALDNAFSLGNRAYVQVLTMTARIVRGS